MKVLIILGGEAPEHSLAKEGFAWADYVLCTDSGANALAAWELWPDLLVGDMDSIDSSVLKVMEEKGVLIQRHNPHKDLTDGQLACALALEKQPEEIMILGGWGGRADHSFANLMLLRYLAEEGAAAKMAVPGQWASLLGPGEHQITGEAGDTFSLLPFSDDVVIGSIQGAEYPLDKPTSMPLGPTLALPIGISNRLAGKEATFVVLSGWILCFSPR